MHHMKKTPFGPIIELSRMANTLNILMKLISMQMWFKGGTFSQILTMKLCALLVRKCFKKIGFNSKSDHSATVLPTS